MYTEYFRLTEKPFAITPDPRYLFLSQRHEEALAHLVFGVQEGGGFVQLTGEVGTGKTTLIKALLERLPNDVDVAFIFNPRMTALEFLAAVCDELHVTYGPGEVTVKTLIDALNRKLLDAHAQGRRVVLIVDEAQNFHSDVLEQIRLLTNLETTKLKLLQIILVGQPELRDMLARRDLRQLAQRVTARYHLVPMTRDEVAAYVEHRLQVAGATQSLFARGALNVTRPLFTRGALKQVWKHSGGVPRLVNVICDRALLGAYASEAVEVNARIVDVAVREVLGRPSRRGWQFDMRYGAAAALGGMAVAAVLSMTPATQWLSTHVLNVSPLNTTVTEAAPLSGISPDQDNDEQVNAAAKTEPKAPLSGITRVSTVEQWRSLIGQPEASDMDAAFRSIFEAWGVSYDQLVGADSCEKAISARLQCHWDRGSLEQFLTFDHPGLTWITDAAGTRHYATLRGLKSGAVMSQVAGKLVEVELETLRQAWEGHYGILWQPPALDTKLLRPGARGDVVVWMRRTLDREQGIVPLASSAEQYDSALVERVKAFQRQRQLTPDGLVGEQTFIHLNVLGGAPQVPLLSSYAAGQE